MTEPAATSELQPWYRQGWPWLLISLPASAVIGGIITLVIAIQSPNALVVDDYYKQGLAINQQKHRRGVAESMGLKGLLRSNEDQLSLKLTSIAPVSGESLTLEMIHSTRAELDRTVTLHRTADGLYAGDMPEMLPGTWYFHLFAEDGSWEIRSRMTIEGPFQVQLNTRERQ